MKFTKMEEWQPADGMQLEENAATTVRSTTNRLVVAGPGAGKTELLAQRACYLLQTNACTAPRKILAISFKRDAAVNLKQRVYLRCGDHLSRRFDSFTFDAFAKQLFDRFKSALPKEFKLPNGYELFMDTATITDQYRDLDQTIYNTVDKKKLVDSVAYHRYPLPRDSKHQQLVATVLDTLLQKNPAKLNFQMLMRLAELLITTNPKIRQFLQQTYQFVFLDEFQDTTTVQFEFLKACFLEGEASTVFTAVGDDKQRIMEWANARRTIFEDFVREVEAERVALQMNFRSAPRLVDLQNHLIRHLLNSPDTVVADPDKDPASGESLCWMFKNPEEEKAYLLRSLDQWINRDGIHPRDIVILVKQQIALYTGDIITYLNAHGIKARDENELQDLLTEEMMNYIINTIYTLYKTGAGKEKGEAFGFLSVVNAEFEEAQLSRLQKKHIAFLNALRRKYPVEALTPEAIALLIDEIIAFAGLGRIQAVYPQYKEERYTKILIAKLKKLLGEHYAQTGNMLQSLDLIRGLDAIPVMTVHKSKGLEYHTVVFVGLEDGAFWSFQTQADEDKRTFFVALSRAKERVVFTFSQVRYDRYQKPRNQSLTNIREIFDAMDQSRIVTFHQT